MKNNTNNKDYEKDGFNIEPITSINQYDFAIPRSDTHAEDDKKILKHIKNKQHLIEELENLNDLYANGIKSNSIDGLSWDGITGFPQISNTTIHNSDFIKKYNAQYNASEKKAAKTLGAIIFLVALSSWLIISANPKPKAGILFGKYYVFENLNNLPLNPPISTLDLQKNSIENTSTMNKNKTLDVKK